MQVRNTIFFIILILLIGMIIKSFCFSGRMASCQSYEIISKEKQKKFNFDNQKEIRKNIKYENID